MKFLPFLAWGVVAARTLYERWKKSWELNGELLEFPQYSIVDLPENTNARLRGQLEQPEGSNPILAPMTGRACIAWRVSIEVRDKAPAVGKPWWKEPEVYDDAASSVVFVDPTGRALLRDGAQWRLDMDAKGGGGQWNDLNAPAAAPLRTLFAQTDVAMDYQRWDQDVRVQEGVVRVGDPVVVGASGRWELNPEATSAYREVERRRRLEKMTNGQLVVTTDRRMLRRTPSRS